MAAPRTLTIHSAWPGLSLVSPTGPVYAIDNFLADYECQALIDDGEAGGFKASHTEDHLPHPSRTSSSWYAPREAFIWLYDRIRMLLPGTSDVYYEPVQVTKYIPREFYKAHYDSFNEASEEGRACMETGGQRVGTVLMYLNKPASGGATRFNKLGLAITPEIGKCVVFFPCDLTGVPQTSMLHEAEPSSDDIKYVAQVWIRQKPVTARGLVV